MPHVPSKPTFRNNSDIRSNRRPAETTRSRIFYSMSVRDIASILLTAMAVMLRSQGIATRIVNGFQRGEYNDAAGRLCRSPAQCALVGRGIFSRE
jgi:hypothetical protein